MTEPTDRPQGPRRRRDPAESAPKIAESDRPNPAELARARELASKRHRVPPIWRE